MRKIPFVMFMSIMFFLLVLPMIVQAIPVRNISGLTSITFWETTGVPIAYTFGIGSSQLTTRLSDPLSIGNNDFSGVPTSEFYDVYYSDANGNLNIEGEFLTISGTFSQTLPAGGGLNLAEIGLNFSSNPTEFGNYVASFVALGDNAFPQSVGYSIDGDLQTHTTMGNTVGQSDRLRITLGFLSSSGPVPEPSTLILLGTGFAAVFLAGRKRK